MFDDSWARGGIGGVDFVDVVPGAFVLVFVFVVVVVVVFFFFFLFAFFAFFVVVFVGRLRGAVLVLAGRDYLDAGRILVGEVVFVFKGASVVVDCDSLPEWHEAGGADRTAPKPASTMAESRVPRCASKQRCGVAM
jgi:hypothetical protein